MNPVAAAVWVCAVWTVHIKSGELYSQQETSLVYVLLLAKKKSVGYAYLQANTYISTAYQHAKHESFVRRQKGLEVTAAGQRD